MTWTPETNRIPWGLLTEDEQAALLAERDALKEVCEKLQKSQGYSYIGKDMKTCLARDLEDQRDALQDELDRLKAQAVTVKPLEWEDYPADDGPVLSKAVALYGTYFIVDDTDDFSGLYLQLISHDSAKWWQHVRSTCDTLLEGIHDENLGPIKAAAQADYEARILSAISTRSEDEVWNEAIEAAAKLTRRMVVDGKKCRSCGVVFDAVNHPHTDEDCVMGRASWDSPDNETLGAAVFEEVRTLKRPVNNEERSDEGESHE